MTTLKSLADFPLVILRVGSRFVLTHSERKNTNEDFVIHVEDVPCRLVANMYLTVDGKSVHPNSLMVASLASVVSHPTFQLQCVPQDLDKAVALVVEKCREQCAKNSATQRIMEEVFAKTPVVDRKPFRE